MSRAKTRAWLDLIRLPNLFTAIADVLAGFLYVGGSGDQGGALAILMIASACMYAGGVTLNDVCDATRDAEERPQRPIPSGRIPRRQALVLAIVLLCAGVVLAAAVSARAVTIALVLVIAIVAYDVILKRLWVAPAIMGTCRGLNLLMGMTAAPMLATASVVLPVMMMWLYITSVTAFARGEAGSIRPHQLRIATAGVFLGVVGLAAISFVAVKIHASYLVGVALLAGYVALGGLRASAHPTPDLVQRTTRNFVLAIIGFDTCLAWSTGGIYYAAIVALLLIPAFILARRWRVT